MLIKLITFTIIPQIRQMPQERIPSLKTAPTYCHTLASYILISNTIMAHANNDGGRKSSSKKMD